MLNRPRRRGSSPADAIPLENRRKRDISEIYISDISRPAAGRAFRRRARSGPSLATCVCRRVVELGNTPASPWRTGSPALPFLFSFSEPAQRATEAFKPGEVQSPPPEAPKDKREEEGRAPGTTGLRPRQPPNAPHGADNAQDRRHPRVVRLVILLQSLLVSCGHHRGSRRGNQARRRVHKNAGSRRRNLRFHAAGGLWVGSRPRPGIFAPCACGARPMISPARRRVSAFSRSGGVVGRFPPTDRAKFQ